MDDVEAGKAAFLRLLAEVAPGARAVIPSAATQDNFLIAVSTAGGRAFLTVPEDDLIDMADDDAIADAVRARIEEALAKIGG